MFWEFQLWRHTWARIHKGSYDNFQWENPIENNRAMLCEYECHNKWSVGLVVRSIRFHQKLWPIFFAISCFVLKAKKWQCDIHNLHIRSFHLIYRSSFTVQYLLRKLHLNVPKISYKYVITRDNRSILHPLARTLWSLHGIKCILYVRFILYSFLVLHANSQQTQNILKTS